jgi:uncharacterized protein (DUF924 family)
MTKFWFRGCPEYDELCQPFGQVIRDIPGKTDVLPDDSPWKITVDGQMAQLILCDQLTRNCFRGQDEAFMYDDIALDIARFLTHSVVLPDSCEEDETKPRLSGEFYPPYATFLVLAFMHSESLADHELGLQVVEWAQKASPPHLSQWWKNHSDHLLEHKKVIDRFGRYPHRNAKKNRTSTKEELEWLNSDELPRWAKSQM